MLSRRCLKLANSSIFLCKRLSEHRKASIPIHLLRSQQNRLLCTTNSELNDVKKPENSLQKQENTFRDISKKSENLLEKLVTNLSSDIYQKNRVYKNDMMRVIAKIKELNFSTKKQGLLLLRCCTELLPDESPFTRMALVEEIWNTIKPHTKFEVDHYNELLRVYIANNRTLTVKSFIDKMSPLAPNITTYELILRALGEAGDINQATEVIANMKAMSIPATESVFNSLILGQGKCGNLQNINEILSMMKSLKLEPSTDTVTAQARALIWNKQYNKAIEEMERAVRNGMQFSERNVLEIVKTLAFMGVYGPIAQVLKFLPPTTLTTPSISPYMQSVATLLVFQNHPLAALEIYKCLPLPSFGPKDDQGLHGRSLVRDCVKASMPSNIVNLVAHELMTSGRNTIAIQNAAEAALQLNKIPLALDLFTRMKQLGLPLRPHYFWPVLLYNSRTFGEKGIMSVLQTMVSMDVKPDYETIKHYVIPFVSFTSPQNLMKKFTDTGLNVSTVLTPMMEVLLNTGQVRAASELCELFQGKVDTEILLKPLLKGYIISGDLKSTIFALEDMTEKAQDQTKDWPGRFLCVCIQDQKIQDDTTEFMRLVKAISKTKLRISAAAVDYCISRIPEKYKQKTRETIHNSLIEITDEKVIDDSELFVNQMPHPKKMDEAALKAHLIELEAKGMNTRGVLRKLLQMYCRHGKFQDAREIAEKCRREGVFLSAGMKAAIFDLHVKLGELESAELALIDLQKTSPNFTLDEFKVIDFATLMVFRGEIDKAMEFISSEAKKRRITGGRSIERNCWRLLEAMASKGNIENTKKMIDLLLSSGYCKPSNVLLGPLVKTHLNNDNLEEAVKEYVELAQKYNKTPYKHELLCKILLKMADGKTEDFFLANEKAKGKMNTLAQSILNMDKKVHGPGDVQLTLIAALADVGYTLTLRKMFLDPTVKFHNDALFRRCERFAQEKKVHALLNIAECARDIRHVEVNLIYELVLDVFQRDDNVKQALDLWEKMQELDFTPTEKFVKNLCSLLKANNKTIPSDLVLFLEKQARKKAN